MNGQGVVKPLTVFIYSKGNAKYYYYFCRKLE